MKKPTLGKSVQSQQQSEKIAAMFMFVVSENKFLRAVYQGDGLG